MAHYVTTGSVGPHDEGELIEMTAEHEKKGHDPARLLRLGAIRDATDADRTDPVSGQERRPTPIGTSGKAARNLPAIKPAVATPAGAQPAPAGESEAKEDSPRGSSGTASSSSSPSGSTGKKSGS